MVFVPHHLAYMFNSSFLAAQGATSLGPCPRSLITHFSPCGGPLVWLVCGFMCESPDSPTENKF